MDLPSVRRIMQQGRRSVNSDNGRTAKVGSRVPPKRRYELRKRAEQVADTRRRITEATVELHRTIGPSATRVSEIARRAGVQRVTVYTHFPDDDSLIAACSAHWRSLHPRPETAKWQAIEEPSERLRRTLTDLYAWYRETEPMTANLLRDAPAVPALRPYVQRDIEEYVKEVARFVASPFRARGRRHERLMVTAETVLGFHAWRVLSRLEDEEAVELAARFVELVAEVPSAPPRARLERSRT